MEFVSPGTCLLEEGIKNKWRWAWLEERGQDGKPLSSWCQKLAVPGACFCVVCHKKLLYATSGKKALLRHDSDKAHRAAVQALLDTCTLPGATSTVPEDQRVLLMCPCCEAELAVSLKPGSRHEFALSLSKKEKGTQPSSSDPASTYPQPKNSMDHEAPEDQGASGMETNRGPGMDHSIKMKQDSGDPDGLSMKKEKKHEGKQPASSRPELETGRENSNIKSQKYVQTKRSSSLKLSTVKVGCVVAADACGADKAIMNAIMDNKWSSPHVEETHLDNCDVLIVFCPILSRAGSDVDRAMKDPKVVLAKKPVILVLMHHTRDPDYSTGGTHWPDVYNDVKVVFHVLFHDTQRGLLTCKHNRQMIATLQQEVYKYKRWRT